MKRLEKAFKTLGEKPEQVSCHAAEGMAKELKETKKEKPSGVVKELALVMGGNKSEHYEISSYTMLIQMAKNLGEKDVADLLKENLKDEEEADKLLRSLGKSLGKEAKEEANA